MGIEPKLFRKEEDIGNPDLIKKSETDRFRDPQKVDQIIELDKQWRKLKWEADNLRKDKALIQKDITEIKKKDKKADCSELVSKQKQIDTQIQEQNLKVDDSQKTLNKAINSIGNIIHESVPLNNNEDFNRIDKVHGQKPEIIVNGTKGKAHHHQILWMINGFDPKKGRLISGQRGLFLKGPAVMLSLALQQYSLSFLSKKNYTPVQPPYFMKQSIMQKTCQLSDFDEQLYKIEGDTEPNYLIATSEQPISCLHMNDWLHPNQLPMKYAGISTCFRKEAGAHGKQTWGIFRVHQFEKIEQFVYSSPENSYKELEDMLTTSEEFMQSLGFHYRVVSIVSGALNDAAAKKYDIECWFPGYNEFMELCSLSNCTDYQSRPIETRFGTKKEDSKQKEYVHMLNGTLCAIQRMVTCILENYQTEEGVIVPEVLRKYMGMDIIPYTQDLPQKGDIE